MVTFMEASEGDFPQLGGIFEDSFLTEHPLEDLGGCQFLVAAMIGSQLAVSHAMAAFVMKFFVFDAAVVTLLGKGEHSTDKLFIGLTVLLTTAHTIPRASLSMTAYLDTVLVSPREAEQTVLHSPFSSCSNTTPIPRREASDATRVQLYLPEVVLTIELTEDFGTSKFGHGLNN
ncbi:hypothetical protein B566_EDAN014779 [Ephemera danica]|nr:hypothetical protein B566_EDAN014779 [Ephemera danica]